MPALNEVDTSCDEVMRLAENLPETQWGAPRLWRAADTLRALLARPEALLLDEPFSRLDAGLRDQIRRFTFARTRAQGLPVILALDPGEGIVLSYGDDDVIGFNKYIGF